MKKTREELFSDLNALLKDDTSDEALSFIENLADSIDDYEKNSGEDWKKRFEENEANWRKKYKERFFGSSENEDPDFKDLPPEGKVRSFSDLFK